MGMGEGSLQTVRNEAKTLGRVCAPLRKLKSMSSIKRDVKKKAPPRPEGEKILSRDPAHFTVSVPLDVRERFCSGLFAIPVGSSSGGDDANRVLKLASETGI